MDKATFLDNLRTTRERWEAALAHLENSQMEAPRKGGSWSIKDIIAHVTWFEREMVGLLNTRSLTGSDLWNLPTDKRNAAIHAENRQRPLEEILADGSHNYRQMLAAVEGLSEEELNDPRRFKYMPEDWVPWQIIAQNSYEHYEAHLPELENHTN